MVKAIPMEDWLRGCVYHDGRHGYVTLPIDKVHQIANYIQRTRRSVSDGLIDLAVEPIAEQTENSLEKPNNSTSSKMEQVDEPQTCSVNGRPYSVCSSREHFRCTADEPQTEREGE